MNFALDYDGTVTAAPELWAAWAMATRSLGHTVHLVTMRYPSELADIPKDFLELMDGVHATERMAKGPHMQRVGIDIHVWIDDHPQAVYLNASEIWPDPAPEGQPVVPNYD